ncbi:hypothetical protein F5X99DRAFT_425796 [Biscogniauxia marginata]|nr:hypothetical protein F5X99DRAFT_425796 [Biscogniauxia marginata]
MARRRFSNLFPSFGSSSSTSALAPPYRPRTYSHTAGAYQQDQHLTTLRRLREDLGASADTISAAALHQRSAGDRREVVAFADAARAYDQQLLLLEFLLRARLAVVFPSVDFTALVASLRVAEELLTSAGWRILRYADLCSICARRRAGGRLVWNTELGGMVDVRRLRAELSAQRFWTGIARDLRHLVEIMGREAGWLAAFVRRNDGGNRYASFDGDDDCMSRALKAKGESLRRGI